MVMTNRDASINATSRPQRDPRRTFAAALVGGPVRRL